MPGRTCDGQICFLPCYFSCSGRLFLPQFVDASLDFLKQIITQTEDAENLDDYEKSCGDIGLHRVLQYNRNRLFHCVPDELGDISAKKSRCRDRRGYLDRLRTDPGGKHGDRYCIYKVPIYHENSLLNLFVAGAI